MATRKAVTKRVTRTKAEKKQLADAAKFIKMWAELGRRFERAAYPHLSTKKYAGKNPKGAKNDAAKKTR